MKNEPFLIALIGFLIVFAVLVLISSAIKLLGRLVQCFGIHGNTPAKPSAPRLPAMSEGAHSNDAEEELTAVISAALMEENGWTGEEFQIVSIDALDPIP